MPAKAANAAPPTATRTVLSALEAISRRTIASAGPRYTPGLDPAAPNIAISYLVDAFDALSLVEGWANRLSEHSEAIRRSMEYQTRLILRTFRRRRSPADLIAQLNHLRGLHDPPSVRASSVQLRRSCSRITKRLEDVIEDNWVQLRGVPDDEAHARERSLIESDAQHLRRVLTAVEGLADYLSGAPGRVLADKAAVFLVGSWGTGKTHFLCDVVKQRLDAGKPAMLVLASSLVPGTDLLDAAATSSGLSPSGDDLLTTLDRLGQETSCRSLLMFDAINEGDRAAWWQQLSRLAGKVSNFRHVALVVSCRRPFDESIVSEATKRRFVSVEHYGFQDEEFDAQLEYFAHYDIPAPSVPLITPEFTRPLFLKILCEALKDLTKRSQKRKLREVASGQKGMTYVLEYYTREIGRAIEQDFGLPPNSCWKALKGAQSHRGLAGAMADLNSDWLPIEDAVTNLQLSQSISKAAAAQLLKRFVTDGLLAEDLRWSTEGSIAVVQFAYQRFGDHLIARHLLDAYLGTTSAAKIRRCFYSNQPLGKPFRLDRWGRQFESPGIAAAIMLEFPERMKRSPLSHELLHYLPRQRRLVGPVKEAFLEGLYWRSSDAFTQDTDALVRFFLTRTDSGIQHEAFEVLVGLATRPSHPYSADWLRRYLVSLTMPGRDITWSEFIRLSDEHANIPRILSWIEKSQEKDEAIIRNEVRLLSLLLTTTYRRLRDRVTRALVIRGSHRPATLFDEVVSSLSVNDPYVAERMLAAAYGVAMQLWADPKGDSLRQAIVPFARTLVRAMFLPGSPQATKHVLMRDYALGVISLARRVDPYAVALRQVRFLRGNFSQIPTPFDDPRTIAESDVTDGLRAMDMDFENYTLGRLIPERANYDSSHVEYQEVRRQVAKRMLDLGYAAARFADVDQRIARIGQLGREADGGKIDRYGKKYSWIAYFEMYGARLDAKRLADYRLSERTPDCDVDPSFPVEPEQWVPPLSEIFDPAPSDHAEWLSRGPVPDYSHLLCLDHVGDTSGGPWVLVDGFIQEAGSHQRETFTFIRGLLMRLQKVDVVRDAVSRLDYLGNSRIPEAGESYYTYAGEVPWSTRFAGATRCASGRARPHMAETPYYWRQDGGWRGEAKVEVPVHRWLWEGYHSELNQVSGVMFPAPALCEALDLRNHRASVDLWDKQGRRATAYWEFDVAKRYGGSYLLYMRRDLLQEYLRLTGQVLVWIPWGERSLHYTALEDHRRTGPVATALQEHRNTFGSLLLYE